MLRILCQLALTSLCFQSLLPPSNDTWSTAGWNAEMISYQNSAKVYGYVRWSEGDIAYTAAAARQADHLGALRMRDLVVGGDIALPALADTTPRRGFAAGALLQHLQELWDPAQQLRMLGVAPSSPLFEAMAMSVDAYCSNSTQVEADKLRQCFLDREELVRFFDRTVLQAGRSYDIVEPVGFPGQIVQQLRIQSAKRLQVNIALMCHTVAFPVQLLSCHNIPGTVAFAIQGQVPAERSNNMTSITTSAIAICHTNTTTFDARSIPFVALGIHPGSDICHFLAQNDFIVLDGRAPA